MTAGLGAAIVSLLLAALGYGAVYVAERARTNAATESLPNGTLRAESSSLPLDEFEGGYRRDYEVPGDDAPLAAEAEYGWPIPTAESQTAG